MTGPITVLVQHLHAAGASRAAVELAVAEMEMALAGGENVTPLRQGVTKAVKMSPPAGDAGPENVTGVTSNGTDIHVAREALRLLRAGRKVPASVQEVGLALLARINRKTLRCDPSLGDIVKVSGKNRRTVIRALALLRAQGIVDWRRYGGMGCANAYRFDFDRCRGLVEGVAIVTPQNVTGDTEATQTQSNNNINLSADREIVRPVPKARPKAHDRRQMSMMMPIAGGKGRSPDHAEIAADKAEGRLFGALNKYLGNSSSRELVMRQSLDRPAEWQAAVKAESNRPGSGLRLFLDAIALPRQTGTGPP